MKLTAEKIQSNWEEFHSNIKKLIPNCNEVSKYSSA